jgi:hypothetical protein
MMDDIAEQQDVAKEISEAISNPVAFGSVSGYNNISGTGNIKHIDFSNTTGIFMLFIFMCRDALNIRLDTGYRKKPNIRPN